MTTKFLAEDLWTQIERLGKASPKSVAVAYISDPSIPFRTGDIVITDASHKAITGGLTVASVLHRAARRGATVYSHPKLHAKILLTRRAVIVGSANLSGSSRNLSEAGVLTTNPRILRSAQRHMRHLRRQARLLSLADLSALSKLPVIRTGGPHDKTHGSRPSLFEALRDGSELLDNLAFTWYTPGAELKTSDIQMAARKRRWPLPPRGGWTWFEEPPKRGGISRIRRFYEGRALVSWEVSWDKRNNCIRDFAAHDDSAAAFIGVLALGGYLATVISTYSVKTAFDIRRDRRKLAQVLTMGLRNAPLRLRRAIENDFGIFSLSQLRRLFEIGSTTA